MASSSSAPLLLTILTSSLFIFFSIPSSVAISQDTIHIICLPAKNPDCCVKVLQSDLRTSSADIPLLSLISIELTMNEADLIYYNYAQIHEGTVDPSVRKGCEICLSMYQRIKDNLSKCHQYSAERDYKEIIQARPKVVDVLECNSALNPSFAVISEDMPDALDMVTRVAVYVQNHYGG
ncbi:hypothetical protein NL676_023147 [Syzygium grande]|nr:hypothetical protein NL676_023147 [Syzygium grande]